MKEKCLRQLEDHIANPDFGLEDHDNEPLVMIKQQSKSLNNKSLKKLVPNLLNDDVQLPGNQIPLTNLHHRKRVKSERHHYGRFWPKHEHDEDNRKAVSWTSRPRCLHSICLFGFSFGKCAF